MARKMTMKDATQLINRLFIQTEMLNTQIENVLGVLSKYITFEGKEQKFKEYLETQFKEQEDAANKIRESFEGDKDSEGSDESNKDGKRTTKKATKTSR
jgi:hypothetical protein